jgi:gliding motility-associated-like protein
LGKVSFVISLLLFAFASNAQIVLKGDNTWKAFPSYQSGWKSPNFDDSGWGNSLSPVPTVVSPVVTNSGTMWIDPYSDTVYFRKSFELKGSCVDAPITITADNEFELYMNDSLVGIGKNLGLFYNFNLAPFLRIGVNTIAIKAVNWNTGPYLVSLYSEVVYTSSPVIELSSNDTVCPGFGSSFSVIPNYVSYSWSTGDTTNQIAADTTGVYWVETIDANACLWADTARLLEHALIPIELGPNQNLCDGDSVVLKSTGFAQILWSNGDNSDSTIVYSSGNYWFKGWDDNGCLSRDSLNVSVFDFATISLGEDVESCVGDTVVVDAAFPQSSYLWSNGSRASELAITKTGSYTVTVTNFCGSVADEIYVSFADLSDFEIDPQQYLCPNTYLILDAGIDFAHYLWSNGDTTKETAITEAGVYYLDLSDACGNELGAEVRVIDEIDYESVIPGAFTPNKDGLNESFQTLFPSDRYFSMNIFNKWGELVFQTYDPLEPWDGGELPIGTYTYEIWHKDCLNQFRNKLGTVALIR